MKLAILAAALLICAASCSPDGADARTAAYRCHDGRYEQRVQRGIALELGSRVLRVEDVHCNATGRQWWYSVTLVYVEGPPDLTAWRCVPRRVVEYRWRRIERGTGPFRRFPSWRVGVIRLGTVTPQWRGLVCAGLVPYPDGEDTPQSKETNQ